MKDKMSLREWALVACIGFAGFSGMRYGHDASLQLNDESLREMQGRMYNNLYDNPEMKTVCTHLNENIRTFSNEDLHTAIRGKVESYDKMTTLQRMVLNDALTSCALYGKWEPLK